MPEKLETHDAPPDYTPYLDAADVSSKNTADSLASATETFMDVAGHVRAAASKISVIQHDLVIHYMHLVGHPSVPPVSLWNSPDDLRLQSKLLGIHLNAAVRQLQEAREKLLKLSGAYPESQEEG